MGNNLTATTPRIQDVRIEGGFWGFYRDIVKNSVIPYQWKALNDEIPGAEPSHCVENFRLAAEKNRLGTVDPSKFYGMVFQDSDLAKWLEAAAYSLAAQPDPELEKIVDEMIALIGEAQEPDGYLNTYYTVAHADWKWTNLKENHELYCVGHMIEAAVALFENTGKRGLLDIMERNVAHIRSVLGRDPGKKAGYPGHPEIELALMRMCQATDNAEYRDLAEYFIRERGQSPLYFDLEEAHQESPRQNWTEKVIRPALAYYQADKPIVEQDSVRGHAVRALYLLAGILDVAVETGSDDLMQAAMRQWKDCVERQMYVTGGVGASHHGEAFSFAYDLPNDTVYAETCASIALIFVAQRLLRLDPKSEYADVLERALYNTCIGSMQLDGTKFLYVNPLTVWPEASEKECDHWHVTPERQKWFGCACCPPNLARLVASLGQYAFMVRENTLFVHLYVESESRLEAASGAVALSVKTAYPHNGRIQLTKNGPACTLALRIPDWCPSHQLSLDGCPTVVEIVNGYAMVACPEGTATVQLTLDMPVRRVRCSALVPENIGKVALQRGPLVYCLEEKDNGNRLWQIGLARDAALKEKWQPDLLGGIVTVKTEGTRLVVQPSSGLYESDREPEAIPCELTFIPYYAWSNRGVGEMTVWLREDGQTGIKHRV